LLEPECNLVGTVEDGHALLAAAEKLRPDVVVTDISMPLLNGLDAARQLKKIDPGVKIVFLTMHADVSFATEAFRAGASGYLLKQSAAEELTTAVREVMMGRVYVTPLTAKDVLSTLMDGPPAAQKTSELTPRQRQVLQLVAEGRSIKEIAAILEVSTRTVEFHKYNIMEILKVRSTAELTQYAIKRGIVSV
jgi:DNA-binding NarL/FixJ family response regulator